MHQGLSFCVAADVSYLLVSKCREMRGEVSEVTSVINVHIPAIIAVVSTTRSTGDRAAGCRRNSPTVLGGATTVTLQLKSFEENPCYRQVKERGGYDRAGTLFFGGADEAR